MENGKRNGNTLCPQRLSRGRIRYASGTVFGIKLKLSARIEGNIEEKRCNAHTATNVATTIATTRVLR